MGGGEELGGDDLLYLMFTHNVVVGENTNKKKYAKTVKKYQ
jgi:hypothetical protein